MAGLDERGKPVGDAILRAALRAIAEALGETVVLAEMDPYLPPLGRISSRPDLGSVAFHVSRYSDAAAFVAIRRAAREIFPPANYELIWHPGAFGMLVSPNLQLARVAPCGHRVWVKEERTTRYAENRQYAVVEIITLPGPPPILGPISRDESSPHP